MNAQRYIARAAFRSYPFLSDQKFSKLAEKLIPKPAAGEEAVATLRDGSRLCVHLDDLDGQICFYKGGDDRRLIWICQRVLRPGDKVLDVGANYGSVSMIAARLVGPSGMVHAFEPQANLREMIQRSKEINGFSQIQIHSVALSDTNGTMDFYQAEDHSGGSSFHRPDANQIRKVPVEVRRASDYLADVPLSPFRLMKVDVEGHEPEVFAGSRELFQKTPPNLVFFESTDRVHERRTVEGTSRGFTPFPELPTVQFLRSFDYELFAVGRSFLKVNLLKADLTNPEHPRCQDLFAVHKSVLRDLSRLLSLAV